MFNIITFYFYKNIIPRIPDIKITFIVENLNLSCRRTSEINIKTSFKFIDVSFKNILKDKFKIEYIRRESIIGLKFFKAFKN